MYQANCTESGSYDGERTRLNKTDRQKQAYDGVYSVKWTRGGVFPKMLCVIISNTVQPRKRLLCFASRLLYMSLHSAIVATLYAQPTNAQSPAHPLVSNVQLSHHCLSFGPLSSLSHNANKHQFGCYAGQKNRSTTLHIQSLSVIVFLLLTDQLISCRSIWVCITLDILQNPINIYEEDFVESLLRTMT